MYHVFEVVDNGFEAFHLGSAKDKKDVDSIVKTAEYTLSKSYSGRDKVKIMVVAEVETIEFKKDPRDAAYENTRFVKA